MLEGTDTAEKSTSSRFGEVPRSRYSEATRPAIAEASSRSMVGPSGRTRMEFGASRSSAGSVVVVVREPPRVPEVASCRASSIVPSWFEYCMNNRSNTTERHARVPARTGRVVVGLSEWRGLHEDPRGHIRTFSPR